MKSVKDFVQVTNVRFEQPREVIVSALFSNLNTTSRVGLNYVKHLYMAT